MPFNVQLRIIRYYWPKAYEKGKRFNDILIMVDDNEADMESKKPLTVKLLQ